MIQLGPVNTIAAEGLKLDSVSTTNGIPTSIIKGRINAATMNDKAKVPFDGEIGADTVLSYAMQWTLGGDAQTRLMGEFIVQDSAYGSDNAPADRPDGYTTALYASGASKGSLQFGDQVVYVTIDAAEAVGALVVDATAAKDKAELARDKAQDWAEGPGAPGGGDTRSAKGHAAEAGAAELRALAAAASVPVVSGAAPGFFFTLLDEYLNVGLGLREDMALQIRKVLADAVAARTFDLLSGSFAEGAPFGYAWALVGADGGAGGGWKTDGTLVARAGEFSTLNGVDVNAIIAGGGGGGGRGSLRDHRDQ